MPNISLAVLLSWFCARGKLRLYTRTAVLRRPNYNAGSWLASGNLDMGRGLLSQILRWYCLRPASLVFSCAIPREFHLLCYNLLLEEFNTACVYTGRGSSEHCTTCYYPCWHYSVSFSVQPVTATRTISYMLRLPNNSPNGGVLEKLDTQAIFNSVCKPLYEREITPSFIC